VTLTTYVPPGFIAYCCAVAGRIDHAAKHRRKIEHNIGAMIFDFKLISPKKYTAASGKNTPREPH
jgi:hypothetical protein